MLTCPAVGRGLTLAFAFSVWLGHSCAAETAHSTKPKVLVERTQRPDTAYVLGPEDEVSIHVSDVEEIPDRPVKIDPNGAISLPVLGKIHAAGLSPDELQAEIVQRLLKTLKNPEVSVNVVAFHSQPVTVLGSVNQPGVQQLQGPKRLLELISAAGGMRTDAGDRITITREAQWGALPLPTEQPDATGAFTTARLSVKDLTDGQNPAANIYVRPHDLISVDRADLVYVLGDVKKSGGFTLGPHESVSVLQALALAEGLERTASAKNARILRKDPETAERKEIPVNLQRIMAGEAADVAMLPEDVLMVPNNLARSVTIRAVETAIQIGTGLVIWRR